MGFYIPGLGDLVARCRAAFRAELPGTDAWLWPNNVGPTAKVVGGAVWEVFGRLDYVRRQAFASTAEGDYLELHAAEYDLARKPAQPGGGPVTITAAAPILVPAGTVLTRADGVTYAATADAALAAAGSLTIDVVALTPGKGANSVTGTPLVLGLSVTGPGASTATAAVAAPGLAGGTNDEPDGPDYSRDVATLRGRVLFRKANPPSGGAPPDYVAWCGTVPGVTRTFVERLYAGPGTVRVFPIFDDLFAAQGGVADVAHVATVQTALAPLLPAGAAVAIAAPSPLVVPIVVANLQPLTTAVETAVAAELADTFRRLGMVAGTDRPIAALPFLATPQTFSVSWIWQAIANATGEQRHQLVSPAADVTIPAGAIPVLGAITFV